MCFIKRRDCLTWYDNLSDTNHHNISMRYRQTGPLQAYVPYVYARAMLATSDLRYFYSAKKLRRVLETLCGAFHLSGYHYAGSERIWMKCGALRVSLYCLELLLADFGRDPHRSESGRASGNFVVFFCPVNNARLCRFLVIQISRNLHTRRGSMSP